MGLLLQRLSGSCSSPLATAAATTRRACLILINRLSEVTPTERRETRNSLAAPLSSATRWALRRLAPGRRIGIRCFALWVKID
ncbi:hypothetical protein E2320_002691 [Naja naja]|nr:hypothetical protein E2320_002691 [Naja naja]